MGRRKINIDSISELPDEVLRHILSFLPTYLSVSTSVLAKRWRFLWAHVPNLEFRGDDNHWDQEIIDEPLNIIERFLSMHESKTLNTFSLIEMEGSTDRLEALIIYAVEHSIRNLYLNFGYETHLIEAVPFALPRLLLTCKTLVDLKLDNCGLIPSSGEVFLPCLKKLDLSYVEYEDKESLPRLLSGCPVLEELIIKDACMREEEKNLDCFIVSSPTIKTLRVNIHPRHEVEDDELLIIDVPALVCLKVDDCDLLYAKNLTETMDYLVEAEIHLIEFWEDYDMDCPEIRAFLSSLCHVQYLKISFDHTEEHVSDISQICSIEKFVNLTKLELDIIIDWRYVVMFLDVADNLEVLVFESDWLPYTEPKRVPTCMLSLRTVRINTFQYFSDGGFDMLKYILKNAKVLERMDIYPYCTYYDKKNLVSNRSSLYERGSKSCQLTFNGHCESEFVI